MSIKIRTEERSIGGRRYTTTQFTPLRSVGLVIRLGKILGPGMSLLFEEGVESIEGVLSQVDISSVAAIISDILSRLSAGEAESLVVSLLEKTVVIMDGSAMDLSGETEIDAVFQGDLRSLMKVIAFVLEVNFGNFFGGGSGRGGKGE